MAAFLASAALAFSLSPRSPATSPAMGGLARSHHNPVMVDPWATNNDDTLNTVIGAVTALAGAAAGVALIAFTENAGVANEERVLQQECVECKGAKVVTCTICTGTGVDPYAELVKGVQEESGAAIAPTTKVVVEDWASGPKEVVMYGEILAAYPVKATESVCIACDGRGVVVCDNCQGTGLQPRFLERYSPDDFMD